MKQAEINLNVLGWNPFFKTHFEQLSQENIVPARVIRQDKYRYLVQGSAGVLEAILPGKLRGNKHITPEHPTVGDWVAVTIQPGSDRVVLLDILPRSNMFVRKRAGQTTREQIIAANIDTLFIVTGLDHDYNLRRIERYVTQTWDSGAVPVVLLNKVDICPDINIFVNEVMSAAPGVDVLAVSAKEGVGLDALSPYIGPGKTVTFVGSSGAGKSTIINFLLGEDRLKTEPVREDDSRGRHATTHRELIVLPGGGAVIDTPGMRELQLWGNEESLQGAFADIEALAEDCRFRDCSHTCEPGCVVRIAIEKGSLDADRYRSYQKLSRELAYLSRRQDESATYLERQENKRLGKLYKQILKDHPKR